MGELFANFEEYDVQATRREEREKVEQEVREKTEREVREKDIEKFIKGFQNIGITTEVARQQLMKQYELSEEEAEKKVELYW